MSDNQVNDVYEYEIHGEECTADTVKEIISHVIDNNNAITNPKKKPLPMCIWGMHGIGKTQIVEEVAREKGFKFAYVAPAQFEEMGDLLGMPTVNEEGRTEFAVPDWVPTEEGPGILLLDDFNRADDRIIRGLMQLLQNNELVSWKLPKGWQIMLTANPDGGDYSVTPIDGATLTRMVHITMKFDYKAWVKWAIANDIDSRVINFVASYPERISAGDPQFTPRSVVHLSDMIYNIKDINAELGKVSILAKSAIGVEAAITFGSFIANNLIDIISAQDILDAPNFERIEKEIKETVVDEDGNERTDIIFILTARFVAFVMKMNEFEPQHKKNIVNMLLSEVIPKDNRMSMIQELYGSKNKEIRDIVTSNIKLLKILQEQVVEMSK